MRPTSTFLIIQLSNSRIQLPPVMIPPKRFLFLFFPGTPSSEVFPSGFFLFHPIPDNP